MFIGTIIELFLQKYIHELLSASFQGAQRIFVLAYDATDNDEADIKNN